MSVEVSLKENLAKVKVYPRLMVCDQGVVVLFSCENKGCVLTSNMFRGVGEYSDIFDMKFFKDYNGEVTLKNE